MAGKLGNTHADNAKVREQVFEDYVAAIVSGTKLTSIQLAARYNLKDQTIRNWASKFGWQEKAAQRKKQHEEQVALEVAKRNEAAVEALAKKFGMREAEVRARHASIGKTLQVRAVGRLKQLRMEDFTPRDTLAMLKLGVEIEREAMALSSDAPPDRENPNQLNTTYKSVVEQIGGHAKTQKIAAALLQAFGSVQIVDGVFTDESGEKK